MNYDDLLTTALFEGIKVTELPSLLKSLNAEQKQFSKGEPVFYTGDTVSCLGFLLSGRVIIENYDSWGNCSILDSIGSGMVFAETYACIPGEPLMVTVSAAETSVILFLNIRQLLQASLNYPASHYQMILNLLKISAQKNLNLSRRIFHTSSKSIRGRLISYLSFQAARCGSPEFTIPFSRQQLADYLNVDRSALSNELGKMQQDGLLKVTRNHFCLLDSTASISGQKYM